MVAEFAYQWTWIEKDYNHNEEKKNGVLW